MHPRTVVSRVGVRIFVAEERAEDRGSIGDPIPGSESRPRAVPALQHVGQQFLSNSRRSKQARSRPIAGDHRGTWLVPKSGRFFHASHAAVRERASVGGFEALDPRQDRHDVPLKRARGRPGRDRHAVLDVLTASNPSTNT